MQNSFSTILPPPPFFRRNYKKSKQDMHSNSNMMNKQYYKQYCQEQYKKQYNEPIQHTNIHNTQQFNQVSDQQNSSKSNQQYNQDNLFESLLPTFFNTNEPIFEIFGLKIFFDDILIICILFFLYEEGIKDEYLFIALIFLLLN